MEQLIIDTLEQYFTSGEYRYCEPNISPTEYRTILADLRKLERIEQIIKDYDGTLFGMKKQFNAIQKVLEQE